MNSTKPIEEPLDSEAVLYPKDLTKWDRGGVSLAVVGSPISHSISPLIHNAALEDMISQRSGLSDWRYFRFEIPSECLEECLPEFSNSGFRGLNLTIPHKVEALEMIDWIDPEAAAMGAVNTLVFSENGNCDGFNTDGYGLERAIADVFGISFEGASVVLLGAGGAARAAATRILRSSFCELWIGNRSPKRLDRLLEVLDPESGQRVETFALGQLPSGLPRSSDVLVINATSLGLVAGDKSPIDFSEFADGAMAYDMIYNPSETAFLQAAEEHGLRTANGLSMLVHQAARSLEIWTGEDVPLEPMFMAARHALGEKGQTG